ncbi:Capsanthin/capsorubin synthase, chromoplastic [Sesamum alatum]|uniref:Capsanthin/capsorubin synthase, chromoplastic n=1 Tax=Sesamum alatum TaxID=300844 RepID=A0AAE1Z265_9LAMI|nr:Capsanthin/capsorubin synthase, chromoplastic [Sesamum alatum]
MLDPNGRTAPTDPSKHDGNWGKFRDRASIHCYTVAQDDGCAPLIAEAIAECLGSTRMIRGSHLYRRAWNALWPVEKRWCREVLSARLSYGELITLGISIFGRASNPSRLDLVTKCPAPLLKMVGNLALEAI